MSILTVSQLNQYMASLVKSDAHLKSFMIRGEISNFTKAASGHCYFSLKDKESVVSAAMFRNRAAYLKFVPENGMTVILTAGLTVYEARGVYQLNVLDMQPDGVGAQALALEQLKKKLAAMGVFDESRKKPLPRLPQTIGVITSGKGAALQDILNILGRRCPLVSVKVFPVLVQGEQAPAEIARAVQFAGTQDCDVIILGRGGGSSEDLSAFNAECVAMAICQCPVPLISAVGHETDFSVADLAADRRAPTPSAAAELAVPETAALYERLYDSRDRIRNSYWGSIESHRQFVQQEAAWFRNRIGDLLAEKQNRLALTEGKLRQFRPDQKIHVRKEQLRNLTTRMTCAMQRYFAEMTDPLETAGRMRAAMERQLGVKYERLQAEQARLTALDPLLILQRGYAAVRHENGEILTSVQQTNAGDHLFVQLADGVLKVKVEESYESV